MNLYLQLFSNFTILINVEPVIDSVDNLQIIVNE